MRFTLPLLAFCLTLAACTSQAPSDSTPPTDTVEQVDNQKAVQTDTSADRGDADHIDAGHQVDATSPQPTAAELAMDPTAELPAEVKASLEAVEWDPYPEELVRNSHYWVSNENFHHLFKKHIDGHGGIYAGVGTDQNYLMGAWARSPILIMVDFDEEIRRVHEIYGVIFRRVDSADDLIAAWRDKDKVDAWIEEDFADEKTAKDLKKTFGSSRGVIRARLNKVQKRYEDLEVATFLTDQSQFEYIRDLWRNGRVFALRGDLTGSKTMVQLSRALGEHGLSLGMLYTSNAEQYFPFTPEYRRNIIALPDDADAMILRTRPYWGLGVAMDPEPERDESEQRAYDKKLEEMTEEEREAFLKEEKEDRTAEYHYNVQPLPNFQKWLEVSDRDEILWLLRKRRTMDEEIGGLSVISAEPKVAKKPPEIAEMPTEPAAPKSDAGQ